MPRGREGPEAGALRAGGVNVLALCAGGLGLERGIRTVLRGARVVVAVEGEAYAAANMAAAMEAGAVDAAPIWADVCTFDARPWRGVVDLVAGGYPCTPFSSAGLRRGTDDPRHLWPHFRRIVADIAPALCVFENVPNHLRRGGHEVIGDLQGMGYRVAASLWTAEEVGAPHRRERLFIVAAHPDRIDLRHERRGRGGTSGQAAALASDDGAARSLADADGVRQLQSEGREPDQRGRSLNGGLAGHSWTVEPGVGRVADGVAARSHRLRMLGNGVVPQCAAGAIRECLGALMEVV